jgi:uncharacterized glyoxalase superfamily protein PhnB
MIVNRSAPPGTIVPFLVYDDVDRAIAWLTGAFGFTERLRTPAEPNGAIHHAQVAVGQGTIALTCRPGQELHPELAPALFVPVEDVDSHCNHARQFGARILSEPHTSEFGERQYRAADLAGYQWIFSQSVADVSPETWGAIVNKS